MAPPLWGAELDETFTVGPGTIYRLAKDRLIGIGLPEPRIGDGERGDLPGDIGGVDVARRRRIPLPLHIVGTQTAALAALAALKRAWAPRPQDVTLDLYIPGQPSTDGRLRFYGRPRGVEVDLARIAGGWARAMAIFDALDPFGYGPEETVADAASPASVTSLGDMPTDRFTIEIVGNGGTPVITSATDDAATVAFAEPLANGAVAILDVRTRSVTVDGLEVYPLAAAARWFRLLPGNNSITFTGCASVEITHRPAYL